MQALLFLVALLAFLRWFYRLEAEGIRSEPNQLMVWSWLMAFSVMVVTPAYALLLLLLNWLFGLKPSPGVMFVMYIWGGAALFAFVVSIGYGLALNSKSLPSDDE